jgi:hypothetical protein
VKRDTNRADGADRVPDNDDAELELAAAAVQLAHGGRADEPLPPLLARRIEAEGRALVGGARTRSTPRRVKSTTDAGAQVVVVEMPHSARTFDWVRWSGWLAAAACAVFLVGHAYRNDAGRATAGLAASTRPMHPDARVISPMLEATSAHEVDVIRGALREDGGAVEAEVIWNDGAQHGTLRARHLSPTDEGFEYQVWLFSSDEPDALPAPAARFRVSGNVTETVVALSPPVRVTHPDRVRITREREGGVIVSKQDRVVLEGQLGGL